MQKTAADQRRDKRLALEKERQRVEEIKKNDPQRYLQSLYGRRRELLDRIESRQKQREEIKKRTSRASQKRLQMIAEIGGVADEKARKKDSASDSFGMKDDDWLVYKTISKDGWNDEDEEDQQALAELEEQIAGADPAFRERLCAAAAEETRRPTAEDFQVRLVTDRFRGAEILF